MTRPYRLGRRAASQAATIDRILEAATRRFSTDWFDEVSVQAVATEAGAGLQTALRHFPTKERLFLACATRALEAADRSRAPVPGRTAEESLDHVLDYYEAHGREVLHYLDQLPRNPAFAPVTQAGWAAHEAWVGRLFAPFLDRDPARDASREIPIQVILDIRTWEHLRMRRALGRPEATRVIADLLAPWLRPRPGLEGGPD